MGKIEWTPEKMEMAVEYLDKYITTYDRQPHFAQYSIGTYIDDIIYGLGTSIDNEMFYGPDGFRKFKQKLLEHINPDLMEGE